MYYNRCVAACFTLALSVCFVGCAKKGPELPPCFPVSGRVMIDGRPAVRANVGFHPQSPRADGKVYGGSTFTDDEGGFRMTTFTAGDGVPAGEYIVTIAANWISRDGQDFGVPDLLGGQYSDPKTSTLKVAVQDKPVTLDTFNLKAASQ